MNPAHALVFMYARGAWLGDCDCAGWSGSGRTLDELERRYGQHVAGRAL